MSPRIDLHTHSSASDGTTPPGRLMADAAAAGLDVVALTDHDTTDGWAEALEGAERAGVRLVPGIEISTQHRGAGVHLLAYLPDPDHPGLVAALARIREGRTGRIPAVVERLRSVGSAITVDDVERAAAGTPSPGRPHVADALVALGEVRDRGEAFERYLTPGRPGFVDRYATPLAEMVALVAEAGGASVIAHPWGRMGTRAIDGALLARLRDVGLTGLEVDHPDHDAGQRAALRALAREHDLVVTGSSDHHGLGKVGHDLGCETTDPEQLERLLAVVRPTRDPAAGRRGRPGPGRRG